MGNVQNFKLGRATLTFNSVALGHTKGGVSIDVTTDVREKAVDQYGSTPVGVHIIGQRIEVKAMLAEHTLELLQSLIPGATLENGTTVDQVNIGVDAGDEITGYPLVIHPTAYGAATTHDWTIYKAVPLGNISLAYKTEEETVYEVTFVAVVDESKTDGEYLAKIGTAD